jgi:hypothetical protein
MLQRSSLLSTAAEATGSPVRLPAASDSLGARALQ